LPGRASGYPPGPPTDPYVRNSRIRFLRQSGCYPSTVPWCAVIRVGELYVSPLSPTSGCSARRRLPSRGSLGPHFPTFAGTMRRYDCHLPISGASLVARLPDTLPASVCSWCPLRARGQGGSPRPRQGFWSPGPPLRAYGQGDRWLSQVPEFPLWLHAPLSDPGGVLDTRHPASRTAACRRVHTVGFPLHDLLRDILGSTTIPISGLNHAACVLATPGFVRPLTGRHAGSLLTGWLGVSQGGLEP
jgi:hypothetical protein